MSFTATDLNFGDIIKNYVSYNARYVVYEAVKLRKSEFTILLPFPLPLISTSFTIRIPLLI